MTHICTCVVHDFLWCKLSFYCIPRLYAVCLPYPVFACTVSRLAANGKSIFYCLNVFDQSTLQLNLTWSRHTITHAVLLCLYSLVRNRKTPKFWRIGNDKLRSVPRVFAFSVYPSVPHARTPRMCEKIVIKWNIDILLTVVAKMQQWQTLYMRA